LGQEADPRERQAGQSRELVGAIEALTDEVRELRARVEELRIDTTGHAGIGHDVAELVGQLTAELPALAGRIALTSLRLIVTPVRLAGAAAIRVASAALR
jgi:hypothetical protein